MKLALATELVTRILAEGRARNAAPLTVVVLDAGGHIVSCCREDGSGIARFDIARGKAWGALGMGFGTRTLAARAGHMPVFFGAVAAAVDGRMLPSPGGVILQDQGLLIGAVGVSGDTGDVDEACILMAADQLKLTSIV